MRTVPDMRGAGDGQAADARESSWGTRTWQVRLMMASFGTWRLGGNRVSQTEDRDGCVLVLAR